MTLRGGSVQRRLLGAAVAWLATAAATGAEPARSASDLGSSNAARHFALGEYWLKNGNADLAIAEFSDVIDLKPDLRDAYLERGRAWYLKGNADEVIADDTAAIKIDPDFAWSWSNRGNGWSLKGDYRKSLEDFNEAIQLRSGISAFWSNRGGSQLNLGHVEEALADFNEAIQLDPTDAEAYGNRALVWRKRDDLDREMADFNLSISIRPTIKARCGRGDLWLAEGDLDKAMTDLNVVSKDDPKATCALADLGKIWLLKGDNNQALNYLRKAAAAHSSDPGSLFKDGQLLLETGDVTAAREAFRTAQVSGRHRLYILLWLAIADFKDPRTLNGDRQPVLNGAQPETAWPSPLLDLYLGRTTEEAVREAEQVGDGATQNAQKCEADFYLGEHDLFLRRSEAAKRLFEESLVICPHNFIERDGSALELKRLSGTSLPSSTS